MNPTYKTARETLFGRSGSFLPLIDSVVPAATQHSYTFVEDESFRRWRNSSDFNISTLNHVLVLELLDKAHLAAIVSLVRTKRWADAACAMHEAPNFVGWASCVRGLLESAGDIVDGLLNIAGTLATNHPNISRCLNGDSENVYRFSEIESVLDHFVLAKWGRDKSSVLTAKANADYVRLVEPVLPGAGKIYQRLCSITHPSSDSINYMFGQNVESKERFRLEIQSDAAAIANFISEHSALMPTALMMSCNPPLLILRVLHKFGIHPKLPMLRNLNWEEIPAWAEIKKRLGRSAVEQA